MAALLCMVGGSVGCNRNSPSDPTKTPAAPGQTSAPQSEGGNTSQSPVVSDTPIKDAVEKLLAQQDASDHPFIPKGTKLLSADYKDGVATLDFSKEFNALAEHGDTVESKAQKALQRALAGVHGVEKMRVTVEGKPFDSQATDWNTPFPVRDSGSDTDTNRLNASAAGSGQQ